MSQIFVLTIVIEFVFLVLAFEGVSDGHGMTSYDFRLLLSLWTLIDRHPSLRGIREERVSSLVSPGLCRDHHSIWRFEHLPLGLHPAAVKELDASLAPSWAKWLIIFLVY